MNSRTNANTQVRESVVAELNWDVAIDAGQIGVEVLDGLVTLSGQVASDAEKWDAERAVQRVSHATAGGTVGLAAATLAAPAIKRVNDSACCAGRVLKVVNNITVTSPSPAEGVARSFGGCGVRVGQSRSGAL